jgi:hypothetical protein
VKSNCSLWWKIGKNVVKLLLRRRINYEHVPTVSTYDSCPYKKPLGNFSWPK